MARQWTTRDYAELRDPATFRAAVRTRRTRAAPEGTAVVAVEARCSHAMVDHLRFGRRTTCTQGLARTLERVLRVEPGSLFRYVAGKRTAA